MIYKKKENLVCEQIDDEFIVFDVEKENFYEFDSVGSFLWSIIENTELKILVQKVCDEYNIDREIALKDVTEFLYDLLNKNLIVKIEDTQ